MQITDFRINRKSCKSKESSGKGSDR